MRMTARQRFSATGLLAAAGTQSHCILRAASIAVGALITITAAAQAEPLKQQLEPFLAKYCYSCHGAAKQAADRRFDTLDSNLADLDVAANWQDVVDQLNLGEMPP